MPRPAPLPIVLAGNPFSVRDAVESGVGYERLRRSDLESPFHGVRVGQGQADGFVDRCRALATHLSDEHYFCSLTAARLHGFRLPRLPDVAPVDVGSLQPGRVIRIRGTRGYELPSTTPVVTLLSGLRVSDCVDTWCQIARRMGHDQLVVAGDGILQRKTPMATYEQLADAVARWKGRPAAPRLRAALADIRPRTDSARETMLRLMIVRAGFPEPVINFAIESPSGAFLGFGDLCYPLQKVVIEYDGGQHREDEEQYHRDIERLDSFMAARWRVIRVNKDLMRRPADLFRKLREALPAR